MYSRYWLYFFIVSLCSLFGKLNVCIAQPAKLVKISGSAINNANEWQVEDMSEFGKITIPTAERNFIPDSLGNFEVRFPLAKPGYYRMGRNILYISPGDSIVAHIDYNDPEKAVFSGSNKYGNSYLKGTPYPAAGSFVSYEGVVRETVPQTIDAIFAEAAKRADQLGRIKNVSAAFVQLEKARIRADLLNSVTDIYYEYPMYHKLKGDTLQRFYNNLQPVIKPYVDSLAFKFMDEKWLGLIVYQKMLWLILKQNASGRESASFVALNNWQVARNFYEKIAKITNKQELAAYKDTIKNTVSKKYKPYLTESLNNLLKLGNGNPALSFKCIDLTGNPVEISDFKGKVLVLDIWATWCGPCIAGMPNFERLKLTYKDNPEVVFISLSIDDDHIKWKNKVSQLSLNGHQWITDRARMADYFISGVPRTIVIDNDFTIAAFRAPSVNETKAFTTLINQLLKNN